MTRCNILRRIKTVPMLVVCLWVWVSVALAAQVDNLSEVRLSELPAQAIRVYAAVHQGGPFASEKDGAVFFNRERLLPQKVRGYYREYTVPTPGLKNRGVRRLVCGGPPRMPEACYYTSDHYQTFRRVVP